MLQVGFSSGGSNSIGAIAKKTLICPGRPSHTNALSLFIALSLSLTPSENTVNEKKTHLFFPHSGAIENNNLGHTPSLQHLCLQPP